MTVLSPFAESRTFPAAQTQLVSPGQQASQPPWQWGPWPSAEAPGGLTEGLSEGGEVGEQGGKGGRMWTRGAGEEVRMDWVDKETGMGSVENEMPKGSTKFQNARQRHSILARQSSESCL